MTQDFGKVALTVGPLLLLAQEIASVLLPISPRAEFRRDLRRSLMASARQQQAQRLLDLPGTSSLAVLADPLALPDRVVEWLTQETSVLAEDRRWVWGAAALGSASLLGVLAYVLSHRGRPAASG